ncbi:uncharacterized protein LOC117644859 [Thrips palmi]|uniref:Uncharacterized protein LOC117644859 n=1 Tax=Thrips palmi TaxID=161013 RepID=A0A6P8YKM6_THRPL|nr:uncharacterized protein LOC117644859 [Thrips palmi]
MGFDNVRSLQSFCEEDFKKIEKFMQTKLIRILDKKCLHMSADKKQKELEKYYGSLFSILPEEYEILGGQRRTILEASKVAGNLLTEANKKKTQVASIFRKCFAPSKLTSTQKLKPSDNTSNDEYIVKQTQSLTENIQVWLETNAPELFNSNVDSEATEEKVYLVVPKVGKDPFGNLLAKVSCPVCDQNFTFGKTGPRWSSSNFYRHIENVHHKKKRKSSDSSQQTLKKMFKSNTADNEEDSAGGKTIETNKTVDVEVVPENDTNPTSSEIEDPSASSTSQNQDQDFVLTVEEN